MSSVLSTPTELPILSTHPPPQKEERKSKNYETLLMNFTNCLTKGCITPLSGIDTVAIVTEHDSKMHALSN